MTNPPKLIFRLKTVMKNLEDNRMKTRRFLFTATLSFLLFILTGYGIGYLIGRSISSSFSDLEWQNCGSPPGKIAQIWLHGGDLYVEMEDKSTYTTWEHFDTCNFYLIELSYKHRLPAADWPKNEKGFWILANPEETSLQKESSSTHFEKRCIYSFQPKANPPGTVSSLTYAYCNLSESVMDQFALLENGQVMTFSRSAGDLMPTDPITTFPIFFSKVCGSLGLIILFLIILFNVLLSHHKHAEG